MKFNKLTYFSLFGVVLFAAIILLAMIFEPWKTKNERAFDELSAYSKNCASATHQATSDFANKKYQIIQWGFVEHGYVSKSAELLEDKFDILTIYGGCVQIEELSCYDSKMRQLLSGKFGAETLHKVLIEAGNPYPQKEFSLQ